jgi:PKD repeat protein
LHTQMRYRHIVALVAIFAFALAVSMGVGTGAAQDQGTEEVNETFDRGSFDAWESIAETSDGGYALAGNTGQLAATTDDAWFIKTDGNGNTEINETYGGPENDQVRSVIQTADGGYALAGRTESFASEGFDAWLIKTDENGNEQFNKTFDRGDGDDANSVLQTTGGGYALAGTTQSLGSGVGDAWLIKTDPNGNEELDRTYGGSEFEAWESMTETPDGGYALVGRTESFGSGNSDAWLVETDASGTEQFNRTYGGPNIEIARSVVRTTDGGYAFAGSTGSFGSGSFDAWLVETDASGTEQFNRTYGGANSDEARSIAKTAEGYTLAGSTQSFGSGDFDAWLIGVDETGTEQFNETYGGPAEDIVRSVVETPDGGYALGGYTFSFGSMFDSDAWLIKTVGTAENTPPSASFTRSPTNPGTQDVVNFDASGSSDPDGSIQTYEWDFDGDGNTDATRQGPLATHTYTNPGTFAVTLTVTDDDGATNTTTKTVSVGGGNTEGTALITEVTTAEPDGQFEVTYEFEAEGEEADTELTIDPRGGFEVNITDIQGDGTRLSDPSRDEADSRSGEVGTAKIVTFGADGRATVTVDVIGGSNGDQGQINLELANGDASDSKTFTLGTDGPTGVLEAIRGAGDNPNEIERQSLQDAIFEFVTNDNPTFNGVEITREGLQAAVFEFVAG